MFLTSSRLTSPVPSRIVFNVRGGTKPDGTSPWVQHNSEIPPPWRPLPLGTILDLPSGILTPFLVSWTASWIQIAGFSWPMFSFHPPYERPVPCTFLLLSLVHTARRLPSSFFCLFPRNPPAGGSDYMGVHIEYGRRYDLDLLNTTVFVVLSRTSLLFCPHFFLPPLPFSTISSDARSSLTPPFFSLVVLQRHALCTRAD